MASQTHRKIAEHLRALADLFDELAVEVTARKSYSSHDYMSTARKLGIGEVRYSSVKLTESERRLVLAAIAERNARKVAEPDPEPTAEQGYISWASLT